MFYWLLLREDGWFPLNYWTFILKVTECCLINTKMEKPGISFRNRTGCHCDSTLGVKVIECYPCVNSHNYFFYVLAVVIIFEDQVAFLVGTFSQTGQLLKRPVVACCKPPWAFMNGLTCGSCDLQTIVVRRIDSIRQDFVSPLLLRKCERFYFRIRFLRPSFLSIG